MKSRLSRPRWGALLLCTALGSLACDSLKLEPEPLPIVEEEPAAVQLRVTVAAEGPEYCRQGTWTLSISVEGGTPERVALERDGREVETLAPPYRHTVDCATHAEGRFAFVARAMVGDRSFSSPSASVVVDRTPPRLEPSRPALPFPTVDAPVEFVFSEPLLPESLQAAPTRVRDGNGFSVAHQAVLVEDGTVLRLVPAAVLRPPVTLNVELAQRNMTDRAGNPLDVTRVAGSFEWTFSYWPFARVGARMSELSIDWQSLALELRSQARPVVAFMERERFDIKAELGVARWSGEAWERLAPPREAEARSREPILPQLEVAWQGGLVLAWLERDNSTEWIHVSRYGGTSWTRLGAPHDTQSVITDFQMALDPQGHPVLVYRERDVDLRVVRWTGTAWEFLGGPLSGNPRVATLARYPAIAVDFNRVVVAWSETHPEETRAQVFVMEFRDGAWSRMGRLLSGTAQGSAERVAVALADEPVVAWVERSEDFADGFVFASRWRSTATFADWMPPEQLQGATPYEGLRALWLVMDAAGEPWVAWQRTQAGSNVASVFRRRRAAGWEPEQLIAGSPLGGFRLDDKGFPWVSAGYPWEMSILRPQ
jgi:hypothetical protein